MRRLPVLLFALIATPVAAQPRPPTDVAPVTVIPNEPAAKLTASYPAAGGEIAGGVLVLKATFDQPMAPLSFKVAAAPGGEQVDCLQEARLLADNRTFVLLCRAKLSSSYAVALSAQGEGGKPTEPVTLAFTTTAAAPVNNLKAGMKAAGLTDIDMPVIETPGLPAG